MHSFHLIEKGLNELLHRCQNVCIVFSGGKDSTALTFSVLNALSRERKKLQKVWIVYVDTLVDPPPLSQAALRSIELFRKLYKDAGIKLSTVILTPPVKDRFWTLLIGKGYPPPSFRFRWCTERLKVRPVKSFLKKLRIETGNYPVVLSGVRLSESPDRRKNLSRHLIKDGWMKYRGLDQCMVYAPLLKLQTAEIWEYLEFNEEKWNISLQHLKDLYLYPAHIDGRTGCWVCTVVRKDQTLERLAKMSPSLTPLVEFREYLLSIRDDSRLREVVKKDGKSYRGPLKMHVRESILNRLTKFLKLSPEEREIIRTIWQNEQRGTSKQAEKGNSNNKKCLSPASSCKKPQGKPLRSEGNKRNACYG